MKIKYLTSNKGKFAEALHILHDWELERADIDLVEIQGNPDEIIKAKAMEAQKHLNCPLIVEDVSVFFNALNGFPGPYIKDFLTAISHEGIAKLIHNYDDHSAEVICLAAYSVPGQEPEIFEGRLKGTIVSPRGELAHGKVSWNTIFEPEGFDKTMGELSMAEHAQMSMRKVALTKLKTFLEKQAQVS